jgi:hypothetical protein
MTKTGHQLLLDDGLHRNSPIEYIQILFRYKLCQCSPQKWNKKTWTCFDNYKSTNFLSEHFVSTKIYPMDINILFAKC